MAKNGYFCPQKVMKVIRFSVRYKKTGSQRSRDCADCTEWNFPSFVMKHFITAGAQTLVLVGSPHHTNIDQIQTLTKTRL